jgi:hypothetical protein
VAELPGPNRGNAWNEFVHRLADPGADYMVLMDADIIIDKPNSIWSMIEGLERSSYHPVAGALAIKDIELKPRNSLWERLSLSMTRMEHQARLTFLCGGLYCGRADFFRQLRFPEGFVCGDDGFLARMAITNLMTTEMQFDRILHPGDASFVFEAYTSIPTLFRQNIRRLVGRAVHEMIYDFVRSRQKDGSPDGGTIIRQACEENPDWLRELIQKRVREKFWVVPRQIITLRLSQLRKQKFPHNLIKAPLALLGTVWMAAAVFLANRKLKKGRIQGIWRSARNTRLLPTAPSGTAGDRKALV